MILLILNILNCTIKSLRSYSGYSVTLLPFYRFIYGIRYNPGGFSLYLFYKISNAMGWFEPYHQVDVFRDCFIGQYFITFLISCFSNNFT